MEHRFYSRPPVTLPVVIYHWGIPVDTGRTRDLSIEGAQIEGVGVAFSPNTPLTLELRLDVGGRRKTYVAAVVRYQHGDRIGLLFSEPTREQTEAIRQAIQDTPPAGRANRTAGA
ncbi:MAG: PilZ domain-containing protein [Gammaproteobacteria bacterium]|nr:PilZ domain-containing protein [Gammaproteobacteria bacterium]